VNAAATRVLGMDDRRAGMRDAFAWVHPDDRDRVRGDFRAKLADPEAGAPIVFRMQHADGTWRHLEAVGTLLRLDGADAL
jgi:PAS domain S-box-containing protein